MKRYTINCAKAKLIVDVSPQVLGRPLLVWKNLRPVVAFAFRYTRSVALREAKLKPGAVPLPSIAKLELTSGNGWRGRAWRWNSRCIVRIGPLPTEPFISKYPRYRDMPQFWVDGWQERLVGFVAHELWHLHRPGHGRSAEYDCELVEWDAVEAWRKDQGYTFTPPATDPIIILAAPSQIQDPIPA